MMGRNELMEKWTLGGMDASEKWMIFQSANLSKQNVDVTLTSRQRFQTLT